MSVYNQFINAKAMKIVKTVVGDDMEEEDQAWIIDCIGRDSNATTREILKALC
jgi:hypothetical protein